jgi:hypothetical protein
LWKNEVTLRSLENLTCYEPITFISKVAPTPLLMIVATNDGVAAATLGLAGSHEAHEPKRLVTHPGGHFTAYGAQFALQLQAVAHYCGRIVVTIDASSAS